MTSVAKRPNRKWRARYRDAAGKEHARHFARKVDAQRWLDDVTTAKVSGTYTDPRRSRVTVGEWSQQWLEGQVQLKPSTRNRYAGLLRVQVLPTWSMVRLADVSHADVSTWVQKLQAGGLAAATVRQAHRVLALVLELAVRDGRLPRNPATGVQLPRARRPEKRFLTHAEVQRLAQAAGRHRVTILTLAYCGLRFGELAALRVGRVDLVRRRLEVVESVTEVNGKAVFGTPKTHQARSVPVPGFLAEELAEHIADRGPDEYAFPAERGGVLLLRNFRDVFDDAVEAAGLGHLTPHELRHTAASLAVSAGANVKHVQRLLGHASAAMTLDVYAGLFEDELDDVADRLGRAVSAARADSVRTAQPTTDLQDEGVAS